MPNLKDLRVRIRSVKSTQKITAAMKMVAASRLRRAQEAAEAARPYAQRMDRMLNSLASKMAAMPGAPPLLAGTGKDAVHLLVVATSDRGLAGGFNPTILRAARRNIRELQTPGQTIKVLTIGRKGRDSLRRDYGKLMVESLVEVGRKRLAYSEAREIGEKIVAMFNAGGFDVCTIIFNRFKSAITQIVTTQQLLPFPVPAEAGAAGTAGVSGVYEFQPSDEEILTALLPNNPAVQIFTGLLENAARQHCARMSAMDH